MIYPATMSIVETDGLPGRRAGPTPIEAVALMGLRILGLLGIIFSVLLFFFLRLDLWQMGLLWLLFLTACIGVFRYQRWAAVLLCGICWFGLASYLFESIGVDRTGSIDPEDLVLLWINIVAAALLTHPRRRA